MTSTSGAEEMLSRRAPGPLGSAAPARIRVLQFTSRLTVAGGVPRLVRTLAAGLDPERFDVHVCSVRPLVERDDLGALGDRVTLHSLDRTRVAPIRDHLTIQWRMRDVVRRVRPDVLHLQVGVGSDALPSLLGRNAPKGRILHVHDPPQANRLSRAHWSVNRFMIVRLGCAAVVDTPAAQRDLASALRIPADDIRVLPLGIDTSEFQPDADRGRAWRAEHNIAPDAPVVSYVAARFAESKNVPLFLQVAERIAAKRPDVQFVLIGGRNPRWEDADQYVTGAMEGRLQVLGFCEDLSGFYNASDVFLSTSTYEGFGLAIAEAMASGVTTVATAVGNVPVLVVDGVTGSLQPDGDADALAASTLEYLADPELRAKRGAAARDHVVEDFSRDAMIRRYAELYERLAGRS